MTPLILLAALLSDAATDVASEPAARPNIVVFLVDDLGWADLGCYGSTLHKTPHIDALAASGTRFTQAYAACPVCSPTRASILTGKHPVRVGITDWIPGMATSRVSDAKFQHVDDLDVLPLEEVTLAERLADHGYARWFLGKWHLGDVGHYPTDQGFEVNIGGNHRGSPPGGYYAPWKNPTLEAKSRGEYLTERLTDEAAALIRDRDAARPFLLYLSYYNVHAPITAYKKRVGEYPAAPKPIPSEAEHDARTRTAQSDPAYASMVAAVDDSVGAVLAALSEEERANTIVLFFSDNGGLSTLKKPGPTSNAPLRAGKGWLYEGGIREPMILSGPTVPAGQVSDQALSSNDLLPTLFDLAGLPAIPSSEIDGRSVADVVRGDAKPSDRSLYWHYPHYHGSQWKPGAAIREGQWKLIEQYHHDTVELYDLAADIGESNDLSSSEAAVRDRLLQKLHDWQAASGAVMPTPIDDEFRRLSPSQRR